MHMRSTKKTATIYGATRRHNIRLYNTIGARTWSGLYFSTGGLVCILVRVVWSV